MPKQKIAAIIWLVTVVYWVALFIATHVPLHSHWTVAKFSHRFDKAEHIGAFAGLALLLCLTSTVLGRRAAMTASVLGIVLLYAAFDETTQGLVPTRQADML